MEEADLKAILSGAEVAVRSAQEVRSFHRKRTSPGDRTREIDIRAATDAIRRAMAPIRSNLGRAAYEPSTAIIEAQLEQLREASQALQAERRKLWKLRGKRDSTKRRRKRT